MQTRMTAHLISNITQLEHTAHIALQFPLVVHCCPGTPYKVLNFSSVVEALGQSPLK